MIQKVAAKRTRREFMRDATSKRKDELGLLERHTSQTGEERHRCRSMILHRVRAPPPTARNEHCYCLEPHKYKNWMSRSREPSRGPWRSKDTSQ